MPNLPTGTVTFLFTDIEGSTALWEQQSQAMRVAVERHLALLRQVTADHHGHVFRTVGDGACVAFADAGDAVAAALTAQQALLAEPWAPLAGLPVRLALHTCAADYQAGDYVGAGLNRIGRLLAINHGGQVLLSRATEALVRGRLPAAASLRDLGPQRLRDLTEPEQVFQLCHPALPADFPALRSLDQTPNNLPLQLTSFVGREREMVEIRQALATARLLTLTGAGGCGKTRLALQVTADLVDHYPDGAWLVELAPLSDPELVAQAVAIVLGVREQPGQPLLTTLQAALQARHLLLVLDNCEHLLDATAMLVELLLRGCPGVRALATSRELLGAAGEVAWRVPSLALPDATHLPPLDQLARCEAVRLFAERAALVQPAFALTNQNAPAVARVCQRLDGIPLALELAAARVTALTVEQIAARLDDRFRLLTGGRRTAVRRQQTLQAAVDWSYDLLTAPERVVLARLSVFAGGWTLEAAEAVVAGDGLAARETLDLLTRLVEKSLVVAEEQGEAVRYRLQETMRQYGGEKLLAAGEAATTWDRHRDYYLTLAEQIEPSLFGHEQLAWLARLEVEHDNLRAAVAWALETDPDATVRLVATLWPFCQRRSHYVEWERWLAAILPAPDRPPLRTAAAWARALVGASRLNFEHGNRDDALRYATLAVSAARAAGDPRLLGRAFRERGRLLIDTGDLVEAERTLNEALTHFQGINDPHGMGDVLAILGMVAHSQGDLARACVQVEEGLALLERAGDRWPMVVARAYLGLTYCDLGNYTRAEVVMAAGLAQARELGSVWQVGMMHNFLGSVALAQGDLVRATAWCGEGLAIGRANGNDDVIASNLLVLGRVATATGDSDRAVALLSEVWALRRARGNRRSIAEVVRLLGLALLAHGQPAEATARLRECLALARSLGDRLIIAGGLEALARVAGERGDWVRALHLLGAAGGLRANLGTPLPPVEWPGYEATVAAAGTALGETAATAAQTAGAALSLDDAIAAAILAGDRPDVSRSSPPLASPGTRGALSDREWEVAERIARGLTNRQIADELSISVRTVDHHVAHILDKLGLGARTQVAAWVVAQRGPVAGA